MAEYEEISANVTGKVIRIKQNQVIIDSMKLRSRDSYGVKTFSLTISINTLSLRDKKNCVFNYIKSIDCSILYSSEGAACL